MVGKKGLPLYSLPQSHAHKLDTWHDDPCCSSPCVSSDLPDEAVERIKRLEHLVEAGILSKEEFESKKEKIESEFEVPLPLFEWGRYGGSKSANLVLVVQHVFQRH